MSATASSVPVSTSRISFFGIAVARRCYAGVGGVPVEPGVGSAASAVGSTASAVGSAASAAIGSFDRGARLARLVRRRRHERLTRRGRPVLEPAQLLERDVAAHQVARLDLDQRRLGDLAQARGSRGGSAC